MIRTSYDDERDTDLGVVQTRLYFAPRNDSLLDTTFMGNIQDMRYPTAVLEARLANNEPAVIPPTPTPSPSRPDCGTLNAVSFDISNLYLPEADLSGDKYSPESSPVQQAADPSSVPLPCTLSESEESPLDEALLQESSEPSQTAMKYWQQLDTIPVFQPRALAMVDENSVQTQGFNGALHGTFLASLQPDLSPEESSRGTDRPSGMVKIQPGNPGQPPLESSPFLRQNVSSRRRLTSEIVSTDIVQNSHNNGQVDPTNVGPRIVENNFPQKLVPVTGVKRPRPNTASSGSSLAQALDLDPGINFFDNYWQQFGIERISRSPDGRFDPAINPQSLQQMGAPSPPPPTPEPRNSELPITSRLRPRGPLSKRPRGIKRQKKRE